MVWASNASVSSNATKDIFSMDFVPSELALYPELNLIEPVEPTNIVEEDSDQVCIASPNESINIPLVSDSDLAEILSRVIETFSLQELSFMEKEEDSDEGGTASPNDSINFPLFSDSDLTEILPLEIETFSFDEFSFSEKEVSVASPNKTQFFRPTTAIPIAMSPTNEGERKRCHNQLERHRRDILNTKYEKLRRVVPATSRVIKSPKKFILHQTIAFLRQQKTEEHQLIIQKRLLLKLREKLSGRLTN